VKKKVGKASTVPEAQRLDDVLRALGRHRTEAIVFEHLSEYCASAFRGSEGRGPTKLLSTPEGVRARADVDVVLGIEQQLRRLASDARKRLADLFGAPVIVERDAVMPPPVSDEPEVLAPESEEVVDSGAPTSVSAPKSR
jgi:hypothetical protein